jgi:SOS response regulatory protein OraA/RecX
LKDESRSEERVLSSGFRLLAAGLFLLGFWGLAGEIIDSIAISVGNLVITESQIDEEIRLTAFLNEEPVKLDNAERKKAAGRLIEQTLIRREMEFSRYPLPPLSDAAKALETLKTRYKTEAEYRQALDEYGISEDALKRRLWWQVTFLRFIDYRFRPGIQVPDADVQAYYGQELDKWKQEGIQPVPSLDDVRASIEQTLTEQRIDRELDRWLADTRTQVAIRYHDEALQ